VYLNLTLCNRKQYFSSGLFINCMVAEKSSRYISVHDWFELHVAIASNNTRLWHPPSHNMDSLLHCLYSSMHRISLQSRKALQSSGHDRCTLHQNYYSKCLQRYGCEKQENHLLNVFAYVVRQLLEECCCFFICERSHDVLCNEAAESRKAPTIRRR
jgi:hypothetical protein